MLKKSLLTTICVFLSFTIMINSTLASPRACNQVFESRPPSIVMGQVWMNHCFVCIRDVIDILRGGDSYRELEVHFRSANLPPITRGQVDLNNAKVLYLARDAYEHHFHVVLQIGNHIYDPYAMRLLEVYEPIHVDTFFSRNYEHFENYAWKIEIPANQFNIDYHPIYQGLIFQRFLTNAEFNQRLQAGGPNSQGYLGHMNSALPRAEELGIMQQPQRIHSN